MMSSVRLFFCAGAAMALGACAISAPVQQPAQKTDLSEKVAYLAADQEMSRADMIQIQALLADLRYPVGRADGNIGPRTRRAIARFQRDIGAAQTGFYSEVLLRDLRAAVDARNVIAARTTVQPSTGVRRSESTAPARTERRKPKRQSSPTVLESRPASEPADQRPTAAAPVSNEPVNPIVAQAEAVITTIQEQITTAVAEPIVIGAPEDVASEGNGGGGGAGGGGGGGWGSN